jgi:hypothetical protein
MPHEMDPDNQISPPPMPISHSPLSRSGRRSLPPVINPGPSHALPSYPSSALGRYYPSSSSPIPNSAHILTRNRTSPLHSSFPLPSASQSHLPSLRRTPSVSPQFQYNNQHVPNNNDHLLSPVPLSPLALTPPYTPSPHVLYNNNFQLPNRNVVPSVIFAPQPVPFPANPIPLSPLRSPILTPVSNHSFSSLSYSKSTLPSTKDIPLLSGKHDWGPWHAAVRTLILHANLHGHIAEEPLPGAIYDPGLWPTYPPTVHQGSTPSELEKFSDWWSKDGLAGHVLTSRLSPSVLGTLPIANERLGQRRSARDVYLTLRYHYGAGDYSAVMVIEARLRQMKCLPHRGGVRITEFINTWRISYNQMEAAGYLPGARHLLTMFADGLPTNTVSFIHLHDNIMEWINVPDEQSLPNIHLIFDHVVRIDNNAYRMRLLNSGNRSRPANPANPVPSTATITSPPPQATAPPERTTRADDRCSNCGRLGHTGKTCFQVGGGMEGKREEYLANRPPKPVAHLTDVEEIPETEADTKPIEEIVLNDEFAAMSLHLSNDIAFSTYSSSPTSSILSDGPIALSSISKEFNSALDSACTNHIIRNREFFHTYDTAGAVPVKTANCGFLQTLAIGDVVFRMELQGRTILWTLKNCLHAPDVPINLISVGALQEHHMSITFSFQKTSIAFPSDHPQLKGLSFEAVVLRRLSFLNLDFLPRPADLLDIVLASFPTAPNTPELWHRRFGHLGQEATRNTLSGDYATGIDCPIVGHTSSKCIPCLIGKSPQAPYQHNAKRASAVCELIHIDTCGPFPTLTPRKEAYYTIFLDDASNYGSTVLLTTKNGVFPAWKKLEASWELLSGNRVKTVRLDGAKEFTEGLMAKHMATRGIAIQVTAPYAHAQAGKAERYVRTIEDGIQTLLADAKLPLSFWGDAALTVQYLRNRLPTSTLPPGTTPYEIMHGTKPDLSHLRVWGCQCFPAIPPEVRTKGGPRRYEAIFVGYEENRVGWRVRDLTGKYQFSRDVVFNESTPGHLSPRRGVQLPHPEQIYTSSTSSHIVPLKTPIYSPTLSDTIRVRDNIIVAQQQRTTRSTTGSLPSPKRHYNDIDSITMLISLNNIDDILLISDPPLSLPTSNYHTLRHDCFLSTPLPFLRTRTTDLSRPPNTYHDATSRPDRDIWMAAMGREISSLEEKKAFERTKLPSGRKAIGLRWTYDYKYHPDGTIIQGKEKARLVAQGFSQRPEDYGETYAPVVKLVSVRILLALANHYDFEIMSFDVKTAFLHARLPYDIFAKQIPGFPEADPTLVLRLLVALYGLKQSAYEWYKLLARTFFALGLCRCEADHAVFVGRWSTPPHPSITMPNSGDHLILFVPVHVDDGLAICNSLPLYSWFVSEVSKSIDLVCLGPVINTRYLGQRIIRDRANKTLQISQSDLIVELLEDWGLTACKPLPVPLSHNLSRLPPCSPNACSDISDDNITLAYQRIVGSITYLAICTRPDLAYAAMALGQFNASPTRAHLIAAKGVLRYLAGTINLSLSFPSDVSKFPDTVKSYTDACGLSDADWASDESDRKSVSGYCFYFLNSLISWSSRKQRTVSTSSTESEYYALANAIKEAIWIRLFLSLTKISFTKPLPILCDNQSAQTIAKTDAISSRTKHIDVRHHFIRQHIADGSFAITWIPTSDMVADIFTKPLLSTLYLRHRDTLGLIH